MRQWRGVGDRLEFAKPGEQKVFLQEVKEKIGVPWSELAEMINVHPRSVRDWAREKIRISHQAAQDLARLSNVPIPNSASIVRWNDHLKQASTKGLESWKKKYSCFPVDEAYRQEKWRQWWEKKGKYLPSPISNDPQPIAKPETSEKLAEFVGIILGDGGITDYQVKITLHRFDDADYQQYVKHLISSLFDVPVVISAFRHSLANDLVVSRIELVRYCVNTLGLKVGNKVTQQVDIPAWVKKNPDYYKACVRGLIDTDGCVFTHSYRVNGKVYHYKKLSYTSMSRPLLLSVYDYLKSIGLSPRIARGQDVRLDSLRDMKRYVEVIGFSNPKHLNRYHN